MVAGLAYYRFVHKNNSFGSGVSSHLRLDVVIPLAEKDVPIVGCSIDGVREHLKHPIGTIYVIAPESSPIRELCKIKQCEYVNENTLLALGRTELAYAPRGYDESGWLLQQFLKLSADGLCAEPYFLALDADTVFVSDQVFEADGKIVFLHSLEHHEPYFDAYRRLFKDSPLTRLSFVSHQMLFQTSRLAQFRRELETRNDGRVWYNAILDTMDRKQRSAFSEYETYGHWMLRNYGDEITREYWFNRSMGRTKLGTLPQLKQTLANRVRSISFHSYLDRKAGPA